MQFGINSDLNNIKDSSNGLAQNNSNSMLKDTINNTKNNEFKNYERDNISMNYSDQPIDSQMKSEYNMNTENRPRRKSRSFFDRFSSRPRGNQKSNEDVRQYEEVQVQINNQVNNRELNHLQQDEDDLDIPACFRRKK